MAASVDHTLLDPRRILAAISIDDEAAPDAQVNAAEALLLAQAGQPQRPVGTLSFLQEAEAKPDRR